MSGGTNTTLQIVVTGAGRVRSDDGQLDCGADASGQGTRCSLQRFVGWNDNSSTMTFHLQADPATGAAFDTWDFAVSADCPGCNTGDPEMGSIDPHGDTADVRIDMNPGYDVTDTVTASFVPQQ